MAEVSLLPFSISHRLFTSNWVVLLHLSAIADGRAANVAVVASSGRLHRLRFRVFGYKVGGNAFQCV